MAAVGRSAKCVHATHSAEKTTAGVLQMCIACASWVPQKAYIPPYFIFFIQRFGKFNFVFLVIFVHVPFFRFLFSVFSHFLFMTSYGELHYLLVAPNNTEPDDMMSKQPAELFESIRWPVTLGYLTVLLLLCAILVIGVARSSRCALIFFSVFGLFGLIICWLSSGIYLASSVALGDFCMRPHDFMCGQVATVSLLFFPRFTHTNKHQCI